MVILPREARLHAPTWDDVPNAVQMGSGSTGLPRLPSPEVVALQLQRVLGAEYPLYGLFVALHLIVRILRYGILKLTAIARAPATDGFGLSICRQDH